MKKCLLSLATALMFTVAQAQTDANGYTTVPATMGPQYANRVFFGFDNGQLISQPANTWDIAFYRNSSTNFGARINDAQAIETYQVSNDPTQWDAITTTTTTGDPFYNPDDAESLNIGAFNLANPGCSNPGFSYGFGCYNIANHHIEGKVIYMLKYPDGSVIKFMITDYFGGYTFKYAKWNGSAFGETITKTVANGSADAYFNYYSLISNAEVPNNEPAKAAWDLMFTRYWTFYNNVMMYRLSGAIQGPNITVAKKSEVQETNLAGNPATSDYKKVITTIGHSWKGIGNVLPDVVYYVKKGEKYYRMYFTENGGATTGNMTFKYRDVSSVMGTLGTSEASAKASFGLFPNPAPNKQVTVVYDIKTGSAAKGSVKIYDLSGKLVYSTDIEKSQGFYKKDLQLSNLSAGIYLVNFSTDGYAETKKLILK